MAFFICGIQKEIAIQNHNRDRNKSIVFSYSSFLMYVKEQHKLSSNFLNSFCPNQEGKSRFERLLYVFWPVEHWNVYERNKEKNWVFSSFLLVSLSCWTPESLDKTPGWFLQRSPSHAVMMYSQYSHYCGICLKIWRRKKRSSCILPAGHVNLPEIVYFEMTLSPVNSVLEDNVQRHEVSIFSLRTGQMKLNRLCLMGVNMSNCLGSFLFNPSLWQFILLLILF